MSSAAANPQIRQIKIKTGVVKRLGKEILSYEKEAQQQEEKIAKMKTTGTADEYDIRKQIEVLNESKSMIPDGKRRLKTAYLDLTAELEKATDLQEDATVLAAKEVLASVSILE